MDKWNPWKVTALAMALVMATALITGLVVANWAGSSQEVAQPASAPATARPTQQPKPASVKPAAPQTQAAPAPQVPAVPTQEVVDACNRYAAAQIGESDKTTEVVKDAAIGAVVGAAVGAAGGAGARGGEGAGHGAGPRRGGRRGGRRDALRAQREQEERREVPGRLLELHALARLYRIASRPSFGPMGTLDWKEGVVMKLLALMLAAALVAGSALPARAAD